MTQEILDGLPQHARHVQCKARTGIDGRDYRCERYEGHVGAHWSTGYEPYFYVEWNEVDS